MLSMPKILSQIENITIRISLKKSIIKKHVEINNRKRKRKRLIAKLGQAE